MDRIICKYTLCLFIFLCLKQDLTQAMEITNKNKYTLCIICYTLHTNIERHTRVHTGEKPYGCIYCNRRFSDSGNCTRHQKTHEKVKFECDMCSKVFTWKCNLTAHKKRSHPTIDPQFYVELESFFGANSILSSFNNEII